jgi:sarcosine oxidase subunit beta
MTLEGAVAQGLALMPALSRLRMLRCWGGVTDMSFDGAPIIGPTPVDGLWLNGGWCYGGFKATPGSGWLFAHSIAHGRPHDTIKPFSLDRFERGAPVDENGVGPMPNHR